MAFWKNLFAGKTRTSGLGGKNRGIQANLKAPPPPEKPRLISAEWFDAALRGRKGIEVFISGSPMPQKYLKNNGIWCEYPSMKSVAAATAKELNDIERYLRTWGVPYPEAHKAQHPPKVEVKKNGSLKFE